MAAPTPSQLAEQMSQLIDRWNVYTAELKDWLAGVANGGPYGDGRYPLTNSLGVTFHVPCPAAEAARVDGVVNSAQFFSTLADAAQVAAGVAKVDAQSARDIALTYRDAAAASKNLAQTYMDTAGTHAANAIAARDQAVAAAASVEVDSEALAAAVAAADADRIAAEAARVAAEAAAAAAATFDPAQFYTKTQADARYRLSSAQVSYSALSDVPTSFPPSTHTHSFDSLTSKPTTLGGFGITDAVNNSAAQSIGGLKTFSYGAMRIQGWGGDATGGVIYLGSLDRYIFKPGSVDRIDIRYADGASAVATINSGGNVWTSQSFNPDTKQNYRAPIDTAAYQIADWNTADQNGWYMAPGASNAPAAAGGNWLMCHVTRHNADWIQQEAFQFTAGASTIRWRRHKNAGTWGTWTSEQYFHSAVCTGPWPGNNAYGGIINASGAYVLISAATSTDTNTYLGASGDVVLRANSNDPSREARVRATDGALIVLSTIQGSALTVSNSNGATITGNGGGLQANGNFYTAGTFQQLVANSTAWVRQPRIFVGGSDPAASGYVSDGDIWIP